MKITILDGYTVNPGDLSWDAVKTLAASFGVFDRTPPSLVEKRSADSEIVLTNKVVLDKRQLDMLPNLRYIGVLATGYNVVDLEECKRRGICVTNIPAYSTMSVAQTVFAYILFLANSVEKHFESVRAGDWCKSADFAYTLSSITELDGMSLGIVGYGQIGKAVAKIAKTFGMKVRAFAPSRKVGDSDSVAQFSSLDDILSLSDIVSLNCPLNEKTKNLINKDSISLMKKSAWLINAGRGPLVNEQDLADALNAGQIAAYCADVLSVEPPPSTNPLLSAKNSFITPHCAWASKAARSRLIGIAASNISAWLGGNPINVVS